MLLQKRLRLRVPAQKLRRSSTVKGGQAFEVAIVVGLGNPGSEYEGTRHNIGFDFLDYLLSQYDRSGASLTGGGWKSKYDALLSDINLSGKRVILCKPQTYMNCSGEPLAKVMNFHKISPENCLVVHDEVDLPFGAVRVKRGGGEAGHNGLRSVSQRLGTKNYLRLRLGVGRPAGDDRRLPLADWVLRRFSPDEAREIPDVLRTGADFLEKCFSEGIEKAMNSYHT